MNIAILWFRQDLRLHDNPAFAAAAASDLALLPIYIQDDITPKNWVMGEAQRWWLQQSLTALNSDLEKNYQQPLLFFSGDATKIIAELIRKNPEIKAVYWNRCYEPYHIARDTLIKSDLEKNNISVKTFNGSLLLEPWNLLNQQNNYFKVYTPYWKAALQKNLFEKPLEKPKKIIRAQKKITADLFQYKQPDWAKNFHQHWQCGEKAADKKLSYFIENNLLRYQQERDRPDFNSTSALSPYLHFGEISPKQVAYAILNATDQNEKFLAQLGWREFSYYLLYHFPELPEKNFRPEFDAFTWEYHQDFLDAWKKGKTGYPIIDAGMRELWQTGYMHNRVRMIVASFLIKDLLIDWRIGAAWFWDTLFDADLANNSASWQWVAGSGADAAPYFRIFNPILQSQKFDPNGDYIRRYVPELAHLDREQIHQPINPIIDHDAARKKALALYQKTRLKNSEH